MEVPGGYVAERREIIYREGDIIGRLVISNKIFGEYDENGNNELDSEELDRFIRDTH